MSDDRLRVRAMLSDTGRFVMVEAEGAKAVVAALSILAGMRPLAPPAILEKPRKRTTKGGGRRA